MTLDEFFAEAKRIGLTAEVFAAQLAERPEFADCLPLASPASEAEPVAWQERQKNLMGWTSWYESRSTCTVGKTEAFALTAGGIPYEFRPLYATPAAATPAAPGEVADVDILAFGATPAPARKNPCKDCGGSGMDGDVGEQGQAITIDCSACRGTGEQASLSNPAPVAAPAKDALEKALDIRIGQGWQLGGNACPVLYTDTINGEQVRRDDLWLATTAGLKGAPAPASEAAPDPLLIDSMCMRWRHDFGLQRDVNEPLSSGFTDAERDSLRRSMRPLWDEVVGRGFYRPTSTPSDSADAPAQQAARDVLAERQRQISAEGWTPEHDDAHGDGSLAYAAASYAIESAHLADGMKWDVTRAPPFCWPWEREAWKLADPRRMLVKSGALVIAEIERLDRAALKGEQPAQPSGTERGEV